MVVLVNAKMEALGRQERQGSVYRNAPRSGCGRTTDVATGPFFAKDGDQFEKAEKRAEKCAD